MKTAQLEVAHFGMEEALMPCNGSNTPADLIGKLEVMRVIRDWLRPVSSRPPVRWLAYEFDHTQTR
jgi:hypothetical protein